VDWVSFRRALGRPRGPLGIRLGDVGMTAVVLVAVELSVATGSGPGPAAGSGSGAGARAGPAAPPGLAALTDREREVVALVAEGLSNEEIAARLVVSPLTAKTHVSRAMTKLAARDRAQLVVFAYAHGLAAPSS
jgi:DNA-binding NarL/FixJ family response regulator